MEYIFTSDYAERVYAGVLGKIMGVYMGRPVEGWPYEKIRSHFDTIRRFPSKALGLPLIVADDDISMSFVISRVLADESVTAAGIARIWLNYIIENQSVLWWGGYGRATEHTALINLKRGIMPPQSGSSQLNGKVLSEQVGAQIFNDAVTLAFPCEPEIAARVAGITGSVSHSGLALDITTFLARIRADAFTGSDVDELILRAEPAIVSPLVREIVDEVLSLYRRGESWLAARDILDRRFGYRTCKGGAPASANFAMTMLALVFGGNDFLRSLEIAATSGLDTDSNAGVVGMINGVRLGLPGIDESGLRDEIADRMLVVSAKGAECVTDAVREAKKIVTYARNPGRRQPQQEVFGFDYPGSVQGFTSCEYAGLGDVEIRNVGDGITFSSVGEAAISTPTFPDYSRVSNNFATPASPMLYPGETVNVVCSGDAHATLYVLYQTSAGVVGREYAIGQLGEKRTYRWLVPAVGSAAPFRFGMRITRGRATIHSINWSGAPQEFRFDHRLQQDIWDVQPVELRQWIHEADVFEADFASTFAIGQTNGHGFAAIGSDRWDNYTVRATIYPSHRSSCGLLVRYGGRCEYDFVTVGEQTLDIRSRRGERFLRLASCELPLRADESFELNVTARGDMITAHIGHELDTTIFASTERSAGGAGVVVENGTCGIEGFVVTSINH